MKLLFAWFVKIIICFILMIHNYFKLKWIGMDIFCLFVGILEPPKKKTKETIPKIQSLQIFSST